MGTPGVPFNPKKDDIVNSIKKWNGRISRIAKEMDCCFQTILNYLSENPELRKLVDEQRQHRDFSLCELAEDALQECLQKVDEDRGSALKSAMYVLNSKGAARNYYAPNTPDKHTDGRYTPEEIKEAFNKK